MQIGSFDTIIFEVSSEKVLTAQAVSREHSAKYATHEVLGAKSRLEFLSPNLSTFSLSVRLSATLGINPLEEIEKLTSLCHEGKAAHLILGGKNYGTYILEKISETWKHTAPQAKSPMIIDTSLSFKEYVA